MKLTIDFETRSEVDIRKCGAYVYAKDASTEATLLSVKEDDKPSRIWLCDAFEAIAPFGTSSITKEEIEELITKAETIHAHNASFEILIWKHFMQQRLGWIPLPEEKIRCSAAACARMGLPRDLDGAGKAVCASITKDQKGHTLMLAMCKPRKITERSADRSKWRQKPDDIVALAEYCKRDTDAEYELDKFVIPLSGSELEVWRLDKEINDRGILCDIDAAVAIHNGVERRKEQLTSEFKSITDGISPKQTAKLLAWLQRRGLDVENCTKKTMTALSNNTGLEDEEEFEIELNGSENERVKRVVNLRLAINKSAADKFKKMIMMADKEDQRLRGMFLYHGASTGRWVSKGVQLQNLLRDGFDDPDSVIEDFKAGDFDTIADMYCEPMHAAAMLVRPMMVAKAGHVLIPTDLNAIEGRGLAWLAGEQYILDGYVQGKDPYLVAASPVVEIPYEELASDKNKYKKQRQLGKTIELACGYQGGANAFITMQNSLGYNFGMSEDKIKETVGAWRESRPETVAFWNGCEKAAIRAISDPGIVYEYKNIKFKANATWMTVLLPSGRMLFYCRPRIEKRMMPWKKEKTCITYECVNGKTKKWNRETTYGGCLAENFTQAFCRDILVLGMNRVRSAGFSIVAHVHDEIIPEVPEDQADVKVIEELMTRPINACPGLPLAAKGAITRRYCK